MRITTTLLVSLLLGVTASHGQRPIPSDRMIEQRFQRMDRNGDGKLSAKEFPRKVFFRYLDRNRDGFVTQQELKTFYARMRARRAGKKPKVQKPAANRPITAEQLAFFEKKIRPVLASECYQCHSAGAKKIRGGLVLDTREGIRKGGDLGPAVVPGDPKASLILQALHHKDGLKMPPKKKLSAQVATDFERWITMGAPDPRTGKKVAYKPIDIDKGRKFWAFQPPRKHTPPTVKDTAWPRTDIDRFLLATLEAKGLKPVGDADPYALIRRVYLDLIGLPPSPEVVKAFARDPSADAFPRVVDQLLNSPRFGERWGRHWLDVARYGESSGAQTNFNFPHAWRYRDYVIAAFNDDKPYNQFIKEQIAGDLLPSSNARQRAQQQIATGFLAIGPKPLNERKRLQFEMDLADEQLDTTTRAFLGITAACARCHDHKFDPIPQHDYYALVGIFRSTETCYGTIRLPQSYNPSSLIALSRETGLPAGRPPLTAALRTRLENQVERTRKQLSSSSGANRFRQRLILSTLQSRLNSYEEGNSPKMYAMGVRERWRPVNSPIFERGEIDKPGEVVSRGALQVVSPNFPAIRKGSGRLQLARWLASEENPLTARVMVNRIWLHLFGQGLVATPDNFGAAGQKPSHPELLDHLALSFMKNGWSVKKMIRQIVLSRAYQLSSRYSARQHEIDPGNTLIWRMSKRRLDAESLRDAMLFVSDALDLNPSAGSLVAQSGEGFSRALQRRLGGELYRFTGRSVYLPVLRDQLPESLDLFDAADPSSVVGARVTTTVPSQGLYLLNNPWVMRQADYATNRLLAEETRDPDRIRLAYLRFFSRPATDKEVQAAQKYLHHFTQELLKEDKTTLEKATRVQRYRARRGAWVSFSQALFASAEFLYLN